MKKIIIYYNFIVTGTIVLIGFLGAENYFQLATATIFYPLALYFGFLVLPRKGKAIVHPALIRPVEETVAGKPKKKAAGDVGEIKTDVVELKRQKGEGFDLDRRAFLKLIGSAGMSVFMLSVFTKKAQAAFFGSVPGPGTVAIKDTTGTPIDPAEKHPTDGYRISAIDDSSPAFYGFINKSGSWFIMKEADDGEYLYYKKTVGDDNFQTEWPNRAGFVYNYFDEIF